MDAPDIDHEIQHQSMLFHLAISGINGPDDDRQLSRAANFALILGELRYQLQAERRRNSPLADWTDDRIATLKRLWTEGRSASYIAEELGGISRNGVIGKAHRLGLPRHPKATT